MFVSDVKKVLVTGSKGFIGKNLVIRLVEQSDFEVVTFDRGDSYELLDYYVESSDVVVHLAGANRPLDNDDFYKINITLTERLLESVNKSGKTIPIYYSSSIHAEGNTQYGDSKLKAENLIKQFSRVNNSPAVLYRLPGVFGKWGKPNYNSVVSTFAHNIANELPIKIDNPDTKIKLVYIDDFIDTLFNDIRNPVRGCYFKNVSPEYERTLQEIAAQLLDFHDKRKELFVDAVGLGFTRCLYSTYVSYLPKEAMRYSIPMYSDDRGTFVEMLKTDRYGQVSYFSIKPGVTRGSHYHHTKTEKFLVVKGSVKMAFRKLDTCESHELILDSNKPEVIDSLPGWVHDITNIGDCEAIVLLWANEIFDRNAPDCVAQLV